MNPSRAASTTFDACCPELFQALADGNRLALLRRLAAAREPRTVTELADCCGVHISGVSRHLAKLRAAGIVSAEKSGREVRYRLERRFLCSSLRRLAAALDSPPRQSRRSCRPGICRQPRTKRTKS